MTQDNAENEAKYLEIAKDALFKDVGHFDRIGAEESAWLAAQLANWPRRIDNRFTTDERFLRMSAAQYIVNSLSQPSPLSGDVVNRVASVLRHTEVGHPFDDGTRQTLDDALADGLNWTPNDDSAADVYEAGQALASAAIAAIQNGYPPEVIAAAKEKGRREAIAEVVARVMKVIEEGYARPTEKGICEHNRYYYEDCIGCYDEALIAALNGDHLSASLPSTKG